MKINEKNPPRRFNVGRYSPIELSDCGTIELKPDEMLTFVTENGAEYDVARKSWGFYATPSMNGRLKRFGLKSALVQNDLGQYFIMLVDKEQLDDFYEYLEAEKSTVVEWYDER